MIKSTLQHFNPSLVQRTLKTARWGSTAIQVYNYLNQEYEIHAQNKKGHLFPTAAELEITTYCSFDCLNCYVPNEDRKNKDIMELDIALKAVEESVSRGIRIFALIGGEPLTGDTLPIISEVVHRFPYRTFYTCSNGVLFSQYPEELDSLLKSNNFSMVLSIDGFKGTNDEMRGNGSYQRAVTASDILRSKKCFYGVITTLREENLQEATSRDFIDHICNLGFHYLAFAPSEGIKDELMVKTVDRFRQIREPPIFTYVTDLGHLDDLCGVKRDRIIYVDKKGNILNDRRERIIIGQVGQDLEEIAQNETWIRRFQPGWRLQLVMSKPLSCRV